ncbi:MAG: hypothetical protein ABSG68_06450 [Thermoguttaceae bacterium]|jgi:hypothetical protein
MPAIQTRPINNDPDFLAIRDVINRLMAGYGFPLVSYKGSASWLAGAGYPSRSMETYFKLLYRGHSNPYVFGIRRDFAESIEKLKAIQWPTEFVVMPATDVPFVGFKIQTGGVDLAKQRVEKILKTLPEPNPAIAIALEESSEADFDQQLDEL